MGEMKRPSLLLIISEFERRIRYDEAVLHDDVFNIDTFHVLVTPTLPWFPRNSDRYTKTYPP